MVRPTQSGIRPRTCISDREERHADMYNINTLSMSTCVMSNIRRQQQPTGVLSSAMSSVFGMKNHCTVVLGLISSLLKQAMQVSIMGFPRTASVADGTSTHTGWLRWTGGAWNGHRRLVQQPAWWQLCQHVQLQSSCWHYSGVWAAPCRLWH